MITALRRLARATLPEEPRLVVALARRRLRDRLSGDHRRIGRCESQPVQPTHLVVEIAQEIRNTAFTEGKLANIRRAAGQLDGLIIAPDSIFSFWAVLSRPTEAAGYRLGRSIRGGAVAGEIGGGLCQISGIAYELGLRAGLDPVERHPHSRDLYTESERFTPLGLDATVVWPYKDLRLANPFDMPVTLHFAVEGMRLRAALHAPVAIAPMTIEIERIDHPDRRDVRVSRGGVTVSHDSYAAPVTPS